MDELTGADIQRMVQHWLRTPPNGYLGSGYGSDAHSLLQQPQSAGLADVFIDKMMEDLPVLRALPSDAVNVYFEQVDKETKRLIIQVADQLIPFEDIEIPA